MSIERLNTSLPLPVDNYVSFHSAYDLPEYAALFGEFNVANCAGSTVLFRMTEQGVVSGPGASFGGILFNCRHVRNPKLRTLTEMIDGIAAAIRKQCPAPASISLRLAPDIYYPPVFIHTLHAAFAIAG